MLSKPLWQRSICIEWLVRMCEKGPAASSAYGVVALDELLGCFGLEFA